MSKEKTNSLLNCPFCGGEVKQMFINDEPYGEYVWDESVGDVDTWFKCYKCDTEFFHAEPMDTPEKQSEWWNTRKPMERIVERLERNMLDNDDNNIFVEQHNNHYKSAIKIVKEEGGIDVTP